MWILCVKIGPEVVYISYTGFHMAIPQSYTGSFFRIHAPLRTFPHFTAPYGSYYRFLYFLLMPIRTQD